MHVARRRDGLMEDDGLKWFLKDVFGEEKVVDGMGLIVRTYLAHFGGSVLVRITCVDLGCLRCVYGERAWTLMPV